MVEYGEIVEGLKMQVAVIMAFLVLFASVGCFLFARWKKNNSVYVSYVSVIGGVFAMMLFTYGTSNTCGCDFGSNSEGCFSACAYDWDRQFFTLDYVKSVL